jgi:hypothetical protein
MKSRCGKHKNYKNIAVSKEWLNFDHFYGDMYQSYCEHLNKYGAKGTTIERVDRLGNYCKENCIWATPTTQANNRSNGVYITRNGVTKSHSEWARELGLTRQAFDQRIKNGWSLDRIFSTRKFRSRKVLLQGLLNDVNVAKFGTKNRAELIMRLNEIIGLQ